MGTFFGPTGPLRRGTAGARWTRSSPSRATSRPGLAPVFPAQPLDLLVRHGGGAVGIEKFPGMSRPEVVLKGPDAGGEVLARIAQPGLADVDQSAERAAGDQDVRQAVIPVDEDVS